MDPYNLQHVVLLVANIYFYVVTDIIFAIVSYLRRN
jgi:hypothetical protein